MSAPEQISPPVSIGLRRWRIDLSVSRLLWSALLLGIFVAVPFGLLLRVSVAPHDPAHAWRAGASATFDPYIQLGERGIARAMLYSVGLAIVVASLSLCVGFPLAYLITRMRRRLQVIWLIVLLATLTLSDVLMAFSWQVMLSKRVGLPQVLVWLGIMGRPDSLTPGTGAVVSCLLYLTAPFTVLMLYPGLSRMDADLIAAARTLGASPLRAFLSVVVPLTAVPAVTAFLMSAVLTLGSYAAPMVLGRPHDWTMAILISQTALSGQDLPGAAAMSIALLAITLLLVLGIGAAARRSAKP
jgi:putative spermidine/putrescine transport system permease protein